MARKQQLIPLFQKGDAVEVTSDEEGLVGSWFPATIIESSSNKRKKTLVVRYDTLLDDGGRTPLTESVDPASVRPFPPPAKRRRVKFEVNDAVDASYNDGWWSGVVGKVLEGGSRYRVLFDNPPDFLDCEGKDLRSHLDWVSGKWVRPHKLTRKPSKEEEVFGLGADVEVNLEKETVGDTWLPAVVINRSADQTFLVKRQGLDGLDDAEVVATKTDILVVDSLHIRPSPPCHSHTGYNLLDHVEGLIAGSWKKGLITKVTEGKYTVYFQQRKEDKEFSFSELRPHLDWDNGAWKSNSKAESKGPVVAPRNTEKLDSGDIPGEILQLDNINGKTPCSSTTRISMDDSIISAENSNVFASNNKKMKVISDISGKQVSHRDSLMEGDAGEAPLSVIRQKKTSNQKATSSLPVEETLCDLVISNPQKGRLTNAKSSPVCNQLSAKTKKRQANLVDLDCHQVAKVASIDRDTKSPVGSSLVSVTDKEASPENSSDTLVKNGKDVLKEDGGLSAARISHSSNSSPTRAGDRLNPLGAKKQGRESMSLDNGSMSLESSSTDSDRKKMVVKAVTDEVGGQLQLDLESTVPQTQVVEKSADIPQNEADSANSDSLPFVKKSPIWPILESEDIFRNLPQRPHFLPLKNFEEKYREGAAIGVTVLFANVFKKISSLTIYNARSSFDFERSFSDLEKHGFDVSVPRGRVNKLLSIRNPHTNWLDEAKNTERELNEHVEEKRKLEATVNELDAKISALQQTIAATKGEMEGKDARTTVVQSQVDEMKKHIGYERSEFERVVNRPWKLPR